MYQILTKIGQEGLGQTTGQPNLEPEPTHPTLINPREKPSATGIPNPKANGVTGKPKPGATGRPGQRTSEPEPLCNVLDVPATEQGTTPEPLYNVLDGPDSGQDYEAPSIEPLYNVLEGPNATESSHERGTSTEKEPLYNVLEGPEAKNGPINGPDNDPLYNVLEGPETNQNTHKRGPSTEKEPLCNVLKCPDAERSPLATQGPSASSDEPLYNVLEGPDSDGFKQSARNVASSPDGRDNPAYEQTLELNAPYAAVQRPGTQKESEYEPLRSTQDLYEPLGQSGHTRSC